MVRGRGLELLDDLADLFILGRRFDPSIQVIETLAKTPVRLDQGFRFPPQLLDPVTNTLSGNFMRPLRYIEDCRRS